MRRRRHQVSRRFIDIVQSFDVGNATRSFDRKPKCIRRLRVPTFEDFGFGQAVESAVDFDRREASRIEGEKFRLLNVFGVEGAFPRFVETARPRNDFGMHHLEHQRTRDTELGD